MMKSLIFALQRIGGAPVSRLKSHGWAHRFCSGSCSRSRYSGFWIKLAIMTGLTILSVMQQELLPWVRLGSSWIWLVAFVLTIAWSQSQLWTSCNDTGSLALYA